MPQFSAMRVKEFLDAAEARDGELGRARLGAFLKIVWTQEQYLQFVRQYAPGDFDTLREEAMTLCESLPLLLLIDRQTARAVLGALSTDYKEHSDDPAKRD